MKPGTGKTSTVTELIFQAVARGLRVLVCAPSNIAVDTLMERVLHQSELLIGPKAKEKNKTGANVSTAQLPRVLRLGHPARVTEQVLQYCLDSQISRDEVHSVETTQLSPTLKMLIMPLTQYVGHRNCRWHSERNCRVAKVSVRRRCQKRAIREIQGNSFRDAIITKRATTKRVTNCPLLN